MKEVLLDALIDSIKILPFVFLIYVIMEGIESAKKKEKIEKALQGAGAPVFSAVLGIVPECGFPVMCAKLFDTGLIRTGTLIAAFISASDEGLVVLLSSGAGFTSVLKLFIFKLIFAIIFGEILNVLFKKYDKHVCPDDCCIECGEHPKSKTEKYLLHPLYHTAKLFVYIFILNIVIGGLMFALGEDKITIFMENSEYLQPLIATVIGIIPNCASSIILAGGYVNGILSFSGLLSGLTANAGLGLLILFKNKGKIKRTLVIVGILIICSVISGYVALGFDKIIFAS